MATPEGLFGTRTLGVSFRSYQERLLEEVGAKLDAGDRRIHIVAPPGAGKTLLGLALVERIGERAVVLCPNTTIQGQWPDKARRFLVELDEVAEAFEQTGQSAPADAVSVDPESRAPVLALTYQLFAARQDPRRAADRLFSELAEGGYRTLVLDECHHLTGHWAELIGRFLKENDGCTVVALTATPPVDREDRAVARYLSLVGEVDAQVPLPAVVRDGLLAPFQDLARFVVPTESEARFVRDRHATLEGVVDRLRHPQGEFESLYLWVEASLERPVWRGRTYRTFLDLWGEQPDVAVALARFSRDRSTPWPDGVFEPEEVPQPLGVADLAILVEGYVDGCLRPLGTPEALALADDAEAALEVFGYRREGGRLVHRPSPVERALLFSDAKLAALREILQHEERSMGAALRALVVTDFVKTDAPGMGGPEDALAADAGGAVGAFRALLADPHTDELDPILVTGQVILLDDEIGEAALERGRRWLQERGLRASLRLERRDGDEFFALEGEGPDWNSRAFVGLVTGLLLAGVTRCVVGTRALLGEGWDCEPLNTLIDLTSTSSYVTVNQVRGRTLRLDPDEPMKTANNWDIVALMPGVPGGEADLERFVRKHEHFYGPTDDGDLERGVGHVHPALTHRSRDALVDELGTINGEMMAWAADRGRAFRSWRVGERYRDEEVAALELIPVQEPARDEAAPKPERRRSAPPGDVPVPVVDAPACARALQAARVLGSMAALILLLGVFVTFGAAGEPLTAVGLAAVFVLLGGTFALVGWGVARGQLRAAVERSIPLVEFLDGAAGALGDALRETGELPRKARPVVSRRADGSVRVRVEGVDAAASQTFADALRELFGPYERHRYLLVGRRPRLAARPWGVLPGFAAPAPESWIAWPVPGCLGSHKDRALAFERAWRARFGDFEAVYVRSREARESVLPVALPLADRRPPLRRLQRRLWR